MGSSGSGSLSDYSDKKSSESQPNSGGSGKVNECAVGFATSLEEVSRCDYYKTKGGVPIAGTDVDIQFNGTRLVAVETASGLEIGYLPTRYNFRKTCMDNGFRYHGVVRANTIIPIPSILVDIVPV